MIDVTVHERMKTLKPFVAAGFFGPAEIHGADVIAHAVTENPTYFELLSVAVAIGVTQRGHVCADLSAMDVVFSPQTESDDDTTVGSRSKLWPDPEDWDQALLSSALVHQASSWSDESAVDKPLVYHERRLFLARQWDDERSVAHHLGRRLNELGHHTEIGDVETLFSNDSREERQVEAVHKSLMHGTSILLGGPGTGKTYTITRVLAANIAHHGVHNDQPLKIALAAPTAKAATRMRESLLSAVSTQSSYFTPEQVEIMSDLEPTTIHRMLGRRPGSNTRFAHDRHNVLEYDLVVIDEMSMVSLPLMARLLEALKPEARLVLVGDPDQLASVENGSILPDLSALQGVRPEQMTRLEVSRRNFATASSAFTSAVRLGEVGLAMKTLSPEKISKDGSAETAQMPDGTLTWIDVADGVRGLKKQFDPFLDEFRKVRELAESGSTEEALDQAAELRVVCAHRLGSFGVAEWNEFIVRKLGQKGRTWHVGQIVVKTRNDVVHGLANGDSGIVVNDGDRLSFAFRVGTKLIIRPTSAVDDVELAYATTVHKAQGSEFSTVVVVVPPRTSSLNTRELLYTAATRAKPNLVLIGARHDIEHAISTQVPRFTGLVHRLTSPKAH